MLRGLTHVLANLIRPIVPCKVYGKENLQKNNTLYMCNHQSITDIIILLAHLSNNTHIIAKKEIFKHKFFAWVLKNVHAFPVDRQTADLKAIKHACNLLNEGNNLLIFPQGTRTDSPVIKLEEVHTGFGMMALRTGSKVVPMMYKEKPRFFKRNTLYIGKPMDMSEFEGKRTSSQVLNEFAEKAVNEMNALLGEDK
ncbi:MAG: 1-acyl-sn-glycerol-3-phosphate acyltransferase [Clostridia bacterium]|jgi:1-acyl-sn-glycerol-3-phosphate acyltransferase|nr:1-acyl-sn-glycerol-3-phosphate acyltransferase [Clostridia bacterium]